MKIYTKKGDGGNTSLYGGRRVSKSIVRFEVIGCLDELNSYLGLVVAQIKNIPELNGEFIEKLSRIQCELLQVGADMATPYSASTSLQKSIDRLDETEVKKLEAEIDEFDAKLSKLRYFILPGGHEVAANLQIARAICRRAERNIVRLDKGAKVNPEVLKYMNRLSDWLFMAARIINKTTNTQEVVWK